MENLDISKIICETSNNNNYKYNLFSVINHYGTLDCGHYNCYIKNFNNDKWYFINDSYTEEVTNTSDIINKEAYILIYKRMGINNKYLENLYIKKFAKIDLKNPNTYVDFN